MSNVVKIVYVSFVTLAILGVPVLLFLSIMLKWPWIISFCLVLITIIDVILVWAVVETLYEEDHDG